MSATIDGARVAKLLHDAPVIESQGRMFPVETRHLPRDARDFIEKPVRSDRPIELVRGCLADDANDNRIELSRDVLRSRHASLTARECDVMERVVTGASNKVIARELGVSPRTVEHHRANVMKKMDCGSLAELIRTAALLTQADA